MRKIVTLTLASLSLAGAATGARAQAAPVDLATTQPGWDLKLVPRPIQAAGPRSALTMEQAIGRAMAAQLQYRHSDLSQEGARFTPRSLHLGLVIRF